MCQLMIAVLSLASVALLTSKNKISRYGYVIGLLSQPFWLYETWSAGQVGMFVLSVVYTFMWIRGIYNHFIKE